MGERHPEERLVELKNLWDQLTAETDKRHVRLIEANRAQQFYADAAEAEAWMGEQELHMMSEEKAKVKRTLIIGMSCAQNCFNKVCLLVKI